MEEAPAWFAREIIQHAVPHWGWLVVWGFIAGSGYVLGALVSGRRYRQRIADLESEAARLREPSTAGDDADLEILTWWEETGLLGDNVTAAKSGLRRFPRTVHSRKTGEVYEIKNPGMAHAATDRK